MSKPEKYDEVKEFLKDGGQIDMTRTLSPAWNEAIEYLLKETADLNPTDAQ